MASLRMFSRSKGSRALRSTKSLADSRDRYAGIRTPDWLRLLDCVHKALGKPIYVFVRVVQRCRGDPQDVRLAQIAEYAFGSQVFLYDAGIARDSQ